MKKEIKKLIKENGILKINKFTQLRRWQVDALGNDVDMLVIEFSCISSHDKTVEISHRNYEDIVLKIVHELKRFMIETSDEMIKQFLNGKLS